MFPCTTTRRFACRVTSQSNVLSLTRKINQQTQIRCLSIHEYQSQNLLQQYNVPVPRGRLARSAEEVEQAARDIGGKVVLKLQIIDGDRYYGEFDNGLRGGIRVAQGSQEAGAYARGMLNHYWRTNQTTGKGLLIDKLYVTELPKTEKELYLAIEIDRDRFCPVIILSQSGGVEVERIPTDDLKKFHFSYSKGITKEIMQEVRSMLDLEGEDVKELHKVLSGLFKAFCEKDATRIEINPLIQTSSKFLCTNAKFSFDDAARNRQKELFELRDQKQEVFEEAEAEKHGLVYVRLDGDIGTVVNGAGLAMATNDVIRSYGGASANFLDGGGQATKETIQKAFEIILNDSRVSTILVNIYGGIIRCDMIAESIIGAANALDMSNVPIVVRLQGTNAVAGQKIIAESGLSLYAENDFGAAARKVVELAKAASQRQ